MKHMRNLARAAAAALLVAAAPVFAVGRVEAREVAYVALQNAAAVAVIDVASGQVVQRIPVGALPRSTVASGDGRRVFVIDEGDLAISVIDTATNQVVKTIALASRLNRLHDIDPAYLLGNLVSSPDGSVIYLAGKYVGAVRLGVDDQSISSIGVGQNGQGTLVSGAMPVLSPDGTRLYLLDDPALLIVDARTMKEVGRLPADSTNSFNPFGAVFSVTADGASVVCDSDFGRITTGNFTTFSTDSFHVPVGGFAKQSPGIALSADGRSLYRARADGTIYRIDVQRRAVIARTTDRADYAALALADHGRLLIAVSPRLNQMRIFDAQTLEPLRTVPVGPTPTAYRNFIVDQSAQPQTTDRPAAADKPIKF